MAALDVRRIRERAHADAANYRRRAVTGLVYWTAGHEENAVVWVTSPSRTEGVLE